ncbi:hypothetical protein FZO89_15500 [Luteimonas viscosa]|uniref:Transmembrane protein n=1 Tax=Luteimonas viscosa TaxID=1132694 RepID=A0A5D4XI70_9GAMM|nr:DUF6116 family protein [Luteimonas viscosa]TYT23643.1 hypothetical protein FZO89_15500 [Luteimonas viscosa]
MANPLLLPLLGWARGLRFPTLFKLTAVAFAISILWPFDPIPFIDEIVLGLGTLLLANWKDRKPPPASPLEGEATRRS